MPWIMYSIDSKGMWLTGYVLWNGCWCVDNGHIIDELCCCKLYGYSLLGSNDNKAWDVIHKVEKDNTFYDCVFKTYEFSETRSFIYIKFILDEEYPDSARCMPLNQLELYDEITDSFLSAPIEEDSDESISGIKKIKQYY